MTGVESMRLTSTEFEERGKARRLIIRVNRVTFKSRHIYDFYF